MAVVNYTIEQVNPTSVTVTWSSLHNGDTGLPLSISGYEARGVSVTGVQGVNGELDLESSASSVTPFFTSLHSFTTVPTHTTGLTDSGFSSIRPNVSNGDGTTSLSTTLVLVKVQGNA